MAFLTLNGIEVKVASASMEPVRSGERSRAFSGRARKSVRSQKREWSLESLPLEPLEAAAIRGLVDGDGHRFSFDADLYSDKGLGPVAGHAGGIGSPGKFGGGRLTIGSAGSITYTAQLPSTWTVMVWREEAGVWRLYTVNSAGQKWLNGVRNDATSTGWLSVSGGNVVLTNTTSGAFDDLVILPYVTPSSWPTVWAASLNPFSALPFLAAGGDLTGPLTVMGESGGSSTVSFAGETGWVPNGETLSFSVFEV